LSKYESQTDLETNLKGVGSIGRQISPGAPFLSTRHSSRLDTLWLPDLLDATSY